MPASFRLLAPTPPEWFATSRRDLGALLSDHLHCERKAAENALALVRRYPHHAGFALTLTRLAHEETSHCVQVSLLLAGRGLSPRADTPNHYARGLLACVRGREPERRMDALLVAGFIEARSHERLVCLERGFAAEGDEELASFYRTLANAEARHAEIFAELAAEGVSAAAVDERIAELADAEARILGGLPFASRVH